MQHGSVELQSTPDPFISFVVPDRAMPGIATPFLAARTCDDHRDASGRLNMRTIVDLPSSQAAAARMSQPPIVSIPLQSRDGEE